MAVDKETIHLLTTEEAIKLVKRAERLRAKFCLHVRVDAPVVDKENHVFPDGCHHALDLSRKDALDLVSNMLGKTLEDRGGRIRIRETEWTLIGEKTPRITYWIG
jgi:hypothetical protein